MTAAMDVTALHGRSSFTATAPVVPAGPAAFNNGDSPSFSDLIDVLNPLQHIPIINTIYRAVTGDHESVMADVIGGALYGGPIGAGLAMADAGLRNQTGKDAGEHVMAWLGFGGTGSPTTAVASAPAATAKTSRAAAPQSVSAAPATASAAQAAPQPGPVTAAAQPAASPAPFTPVAAPAAASAAEPAAGGPATVGDYLVFGTGSTAGSAPAAAGPAAGAPAANATPRTFSVIGAGAPAATSLPPLPAAATGAAAPATPVSAVAAAQPKMFPVPPRNGPAPSVVLPPPTTGPGALPGGKSMALSAQEMAQQGPQQNYLAAYAQALDKYRAMQRLQQGQGPAGAPTSLTQPAAALAPPAAAEGEDDAVTVH